MFPHPYSVQTLRKLDLSFETQMSTTTLTGKHFPMALTQREEASMSLYLTNEGESEKSQCLCPNESHANTNHISDLFSSWHALTGSSCSGIQATVNQSIFIVKSNLIIRKWWKIGKGHFQHILPKPLFLEVLGTECWTLCLGIKFFVPESLLPHFQMVVTQVALIDLLISHNVLAHVSHTQIWG